MLSPTLRRLPWAPAVMLVVAVAAGAGLAFERVARSVMLLALGLAVVAFGLLQPRLLLVACFLFLPVLGLLRRVVSSGYGGTSTDLLLLVVPLATAILMLAVLSKPSVRRSKHAGAVLLLGVLTALHVINPLQGGLLVGLGGLLFLLVPLLWFWIGRSLVDEKMMLRLFRIVIPIALLASLYGLHQVFVGFLPFDQAWIDSAGYIALNVGGFIRPFGTFNSAAEYATYLAIGLLAVWALGRTATVRLFALPVLAVISLALFLEAQRGIIVLTILALTVMVAVRCRMNIVLAGIFGLVAIGLVSLGLRFVTFGLVNPQVDAFLKHQIGGITNPLNADVSTLSVHGTMFRGGIREAFKNPIGRGAGAVSIAGAKFGGPRSNTEIDLSNAAVALGLPGLCAFLFVWVGGIKRAYYWARFSQDPLSLLMLGVLLVTSLQWLNGGQYATAPFPWLILGYLDREVNLTGSPENGPPYVRVQRPRILGREDRTT